MKRSFTSMVAVLLTASVFAQSPQRMSYQAVIRDLSNHLVTSEVGMQISILQGSEGGTPVYVETHTTTPNINGLVTIMIGAGTKVSTGTFADIDWSAGPYYILTETAIVPPLTTYTITGTSQILSVPYSLSAKKAEGISGTITASQVSDFQTSVTNNADVLLNTAKNSYPTADQIKLAGIATGANVGVVPNAGITGATKTKITYDAKGLVTAGADATTADIAASTDKKYVTDAQQTVIGNTSGTNTGDETTATIKTKLGITTLSGSNTGDQNLASVLTQGTDAGNEKIINVNQQGIGTAAPNASSALEISSTTQGFLPPRMTQVQRDAITPTTGLFVFNTTTNKPNYYDGTVWKNFDGTLAKTVLAIGDSYQGGKIAYMLQSGDPGYDANVQHGLIAALSDQFINIRWYNGSYTVTGVTATALGTGNANTIAIVSSQGVGWYAALGCYVLELGGYSDWYLPSKDELNKLYINKAAIGGFVNGYYWSSTEYDINIAWYQYFYDGFQGWGYYKNQPLYVRAIRSF